MKNATEKFFCVPFTLYSLTIHPFLGQFRIPFFRILFYIFYDFFFFSFLRYEKESKEIERRDSIERYTNRGFNNYSRLLSEIHRVRAFLSSDEIHRIIPFINRIVDSAGLVSFHTDVFVFDSDSAPQNFHTDSLITASDIQEMDREGQFDGQARRKVEISRSRVEMKSLGCRFIRQLTKFSKSSMRSTSRTKEKEKEKRKTSIVPFMDTKRK